MRLIFGLASIIFLVLVSGFALAESNESAKYLDARADRIYCLVDFHTNVMNSIINRVAQAENLSVWVDKLNEDRKTLGELADAGDHVAFNTFLTENLRVDLRDANEEVKTLRNNYNNFSLSRDRKVSLKNTYTLEVIRYGTCIANLHKNVKEERSKFYDKTLQKHREEVKRLKDKGLNTDEMTAIIDSADKEIVKPLSMSSNNASGVRESLKQYCLWNGCKNGKNFHFAAKFAIAKLQSVLDYIEPSALQLNLNSDVDAVQQSLDDAKAIIDSVGTNDYAEGQNKEVWNNIKEAQDGIKKIRTAFREAK